MRVGKPIERSPDAGVLHPDMPGMPRTKLKYALLGSALPLALMIGKAWRTKVRKE
jgi:hypothetical protein